MAELLDNMKKKREEEVGATALTPLQELQMEYFGQTVELDEQAALPAYLRTGAEPPVEEEEAPGEFSKGFSRGLRELEATGYGAAMLVGDVLGIDSVREFGLEGYKSKMDEAAQFPAAVPTIEAITDVETAADWFVGGLGSIAPSAAEAIISAVIGGAIGSATAGPVGTVAGGLGGKFIVKKAIRETVESLVSKGLTREAAEVAAKRAIGKKIGANLGVFGTSWAIATGGMYAEDVEDGGFVTANPKSATAFGALSGALELVGADMTLVRKFMGPVGGKVLDKVSKMAEGPAKRSALRTLGTEVGKGLLTSIPQEGAQEGAQEFLELLNSRYTNGQPLTSDMTDQEWSQLVNAVALGAAGGASFGVVGGAVEARRTRQAIAQADKDPKSYAEELLDLDNEETAASAEQDIAILTNNTEGMKAASNKKKAAQDKKKITRVKADAEGRLVERLRNDLLKNVPKSMMVLPEVTPEAAPQEPTKTEVVTKLESKKADLESELRGLNQNSLFSVDLTDEDVDRNNKRAKVVTNQLAQVDQMLDLNRRYGELVSEENGNELFTFNPTKQQRDAIDERKRTMKAEADKRRAAQEQAQEREATTERDVLAETFRNAAITGRSDRLVEARGLSRERRMARQEARDAIAEQQLEREIAELEAAEEAGVIADVTIEQAPERTRAPYSPATIVQPATDLSAPIEQEDTAPLRITDTRAEVGEVEAPTQPSTILGPSGRPMAVEEGPQLAPKRKKTPKRPTVKEEPKIKVERTSARPKTKPTETKVITRKGGKPFASERAAKSAIGKIGKGAAFEYKPVEVEGGWGFRKKTKLEKEISPKFRTKSSISTEKMSFERTRGNTHFLQDENKNDIARVEFEKTADGAVVRDIEVEEQNKGYGQAAIDKLISDNGVVYTGKDGDKMSTDATHMIQRLKKDPRYIVEPTGAKASLGTKGKRTKKAAFIPTKHFKITFADAKMAKSKKGLAKLVRAKDVNKVVSSLAKNVQAVTEGRIDVNTITSPRELENSSNAMDRDLYRQIKAQNALDKAIGVFHGDTIFIFSDNLDGASVQDIADTVVHELRHFSVSELMGKDMQNLFKAYAKQNKAKIEARLSKAGMELSESNMIREAEEDLVESYLAGTKSSWVDRFVSTIKAWARKLFNGLEVSDREIRTWVEKLDKGLATKKVDTTPVKQLSTGKAKLRSKEFIEAKNLVGAGSYKFGMSSKEFNKLFRATDKLSAYREIADHTIDIKEKLSNELHQKRRLLAGADTISETSLINGALKYNPETNWVELADPTKVDGPIHYLNELGEYKDVFMMWMQAESIKEIKATRGATREFYGRGKDKAVLAAIDNEAARAIKAVGKDKWMATVDAFNRFTESKLQLGIQSGNLTKELVDGWRRNMYVPLARVIEEEMVDDISTLDPEKWKSKVKDGIDRLAIHSTQETALSDPLEAFIQNYKFMTNESLRNIVWKENVEMMENSQLARKVGKFKANNQTLGVNYNGKTQYYQIEDPALFEALQELPKPIRGALSKALAAPRRLFTKWVTRTPAFMVRNFIRDTMHTWVLMGDKVGFFEAWGDAIKAMTDVYRDHPDFRELMSMGGAFAEYDSENRITAKNIQNRHKARLRNTILIREYLKAGVAAENANRLAMYRRLKDGGKINAAFQAKDIMDFSAQGKSSTVRTLIMLLPFFNARVQGLGKIGREFNKRDKMAMAMRGSVLAMSALALGMANEDNEEWKTMSDREKYNAMHTWIGDTHIKVPLPFELSILYSMPLAAGEVLKGNNRSSLLFNLTKEYLMENLALNPVPQMVKPIVEDAMNKDLFTGNPIVGSWEKGIDPVKQFSPWTSPTIKIIAETLNDMPGVNKVDFLTSPKRLQHMLDGYFATAVKLTYGMMDMALIGLGMAPEPASIGGVQDVLSRTGLTALVTRETSKFTRKEQKVYEKMEELSRIANTFAALKSRRQLAQARGYLQSHKDEIRMANYYRGWLSKLKSISVKSRMIESSKKFTAEEKYRKQQELAIEKADVFARIYDRMVAEGIFKPKE